ncbi:MAG: group III truncated hemoglobin [Balneolaceae bacterium]
MRDIENDDDIRTLVYDFYDRIQEEERLGPIFNEVANIDWDHHLPRMVDFWSNLLFQTGRFKGRPMQKHFPLPIRKSDFPRWVNLFHRTVDDHFEGSRATHAKRMASQIAGTFAVRMAMADALEPEADSGESVRPETSDASSSSPMDPSDLRRL